MIVGLTTLCVGGGEAAAAAAVVAAQRPLALERHGSPPRRAWRVSVTESSGHACRRGESGRLRQAEKWKIRKMKQLQSDAKADANPMLVPSVSFPILKRSFA